MARVRLTIKNHNPGGTFHTPNGFVACDENGDAEVSKERLAYLKAQGHIQIGKPASEDDGSTEPPAE